MTQNFQKCRAPPGAGIDFTPSQILYTGCLTFFFTRQRDAQTEVEGEPPS